MLLMRGGNTWSLSMVTRNSVLLLSPMMAITGSASSCRPAATATSISFPSTGTTIGHWKRILKIGSTVSVPLAVVDRSGSQRYVAHNNFYQQERMIADINHSNSFRQVEMLTKRLLSCDRRSRSLITTLASTATLILALRTTERTCSRTVVLPFLPWEFNMLLALTARAVCKIMTLEKMLVYILSCQAHDDAKRKKATVHTLL